MKAVVKIRLPRPGMEKKRDSSQVIMEKEDFMDFQAWIIPCI